MASKAGGAAGGAVQGAAMGTAIAPGVGTAIGAAIGAIGGFMQAGSDRKARKEARRTRRRVRSLLHPDTILQTATQFQPKFRAMVAGGIGPGFENRTAANLARSGLTDTGAGEAIRGMAGAVPGIVASQASLEFARQLNMARANAEANFASLPPEQNAILAAVTGGLSGGLGTFLNQRGGQQRTPLEAGPQAAPQASVPTGAPIVFGGAQKGFQPTFDVAPFQRRTLPSALF